MDSLLKKHGIFFEALSIWACETCCEKERTPEFKTKNDIEHHIKLVHLNAKPDLLTFDDKICILVDKINEYDKRFKTLYEVNFNESIDKIKFLIGNEENLERMKE